MLYCIVLYCSPWLSQSIKPRCLTIIVLFVDETVTQCLWTLFAHFLSHFVQNSWQGAIKVMKDDLRDYKIMIQNIPRLISQVEFESRQKIFSNSDIVGTKHPLFLMDYSNLISYWSLGLRLNLWRRFSCTIKPHVNVCSTYQMSAFLP